MDSKLFSKVAFLVKVIPVGCRYKDPLVLKKTFTLDS